MALGYPPRRVSIAVAEKTQCVANSPRLGDIRSRKSERAREWTRDWDHAPCTVLVHIEIKHAKGFEVFTVRAVDCRTTAAVHLVRQELERAMDALDGVRVEEIEPHAK